MQLTGTSSSYGVSHAMTYDYRGQLESDTTTYSGQSYVVGYRYDNRGRLMELEYPSGRKAEYTFNDRALLNLIQWDGQQLEDRRYDPNRNLTAVDRPSGVNEIRSYDVLNQVKSIEDEEIGDVTYQYDANGNKLFETFSGVMANWEKKRCQVPLIGNRQFLQGRLSLCGMFDTCSGERHGKTTTRR